MDVPVVTDKRRGGFGMDLNADPLAVAETDASGNGLEHLADAAGHRWQVPASGRGSERRCGAQRRASMPVMLANRSSSRGWTSGGRRLSWRASPVNTARMLSSFGYGKVKAYLISRGHRQGVEVNRVSPAFSSVIGPGSTRVARALPDCFCTAVRSSSQPNQPNK